MTHMPMRVKTEAVLSDRLLPIAARNNAPIANDRPRMPGSTAKLESDFEPMENPENMNAVQTQNGSISDSSSQECQCTRSRVSNTTGVTTKAAATA